MKNAILIAIMGLYVGLNAQSPDLPAVGRNLYDYQDCMRSSDNHLLMGIAGVAISLPMIRNERLRPYGYCVLSTAGIAMTIGLFERKVARDHMKSASLILSPSGAGVQIKF